MSPDDFSTMCTQGWEWIIISQAIEAANPDLPTLIQQALNTTQAVAQGSHECETMLCIAANYKNLQATTPNPDLQKCIELAGMSHPDCSRICQPWAIM